MPAMFAQDRSIAAATMLLVVSSLYPLAAGQISFGKPVSYTVGTSPTAVAAGDFNGDGKVDLAIVNQGKANVGDNGGVSILLGNGDGSFQPTGNFYAGKNQVVIAVADFNHDGKLDLVVGNQYSGYAGNEFSTTDVLIGNGDGTFQAPIEIPENGGSVFVADLNGDGNADLVLIESTSNNPSIGVRFGNGDGTFQPAVIYPVGDYSSAGIPNSIRVGDFNGDNKLDVVVGTGFFDDPFSSYYGNVAILFGNGDGTLQSPVYFGVGFVEGLITGDFNGDGKLDLAVSANTSILFHPSKFLGVLLGNTNGTLTTANPRPPFFPAAVGDVDGDGKLDLISSTSIALGKGDGTFQTAIALSLPGISAAADFNGDGLSDAILLDPSHDAVIVTLNTTPGFTVKISPPTASVHAGSSATYTINVGQQNGFDNAAAVSCSAPLSSIQCAVSPSSVSPGGIAKLKVATTGPSAALLGGQHGLLYAVRLPFAGLLLFGTGLGSLPDYKKGLLGGLLFCVLVGSLAFQAACGGGSSTMNSGSGGTPAGSYAITIMGKSGSLQRSTTVTLTVQ
jgi:FG-GAP-like repeat/FG-GAP repeat